jgi:DnaJ domain
MTISRYPLAWPAGWPRTLKGRQRTGRFEVTLAKATKELCESIARMGGRYPVISTNIAIRRDGLPYSNQREPDDRGVAVYFELGGKQRVFACDTFTTVAANVRAIGLTIEALRSIERYGASAMLERALSAFEALPPPLDPWQILGIPRNADEAIIKVAHAALAKKHHPDNGGSTARMAEINNARDMALEALRKSS